MSVGILGMVHTGVSVGILDKQPTTTDVCVLIIGLLMTLDKQPTTTVVYKLVIGLLMTLGKQPTTTVVCELVIGLLMTLGNQPTATDVCELVIGLLRTLGKQPTATVVCELVIGLLQEVVAGWAPYDISYHRSLHFDFPSPPDYSPTSFIYRPPDSDAHLTLLLRPLSWQVSR